jgi:hypothetical protein
VERAASREPRPANLRALTQPFTFRFSPFTSFLALPDRLIVADSRAGIDAGKSRSGFRPFLRFRLRNGRDRVSSLGQLIDLTNIRFVFQRCAFLPLLGLLTAYLPDIERKRVGRIAS